MSISSCFDLRFTNIGKFYRLLVMRLPRIQLTDIHALALTNYLSRRRYSVLFNGEPNKNGRTPPWKVLFFGSDDFSVRSLERLCSKLRTNTLISRLDVCTTFTKNWRHKHNDVYVFARLERLQIFEWPINSHDLAGQYDIGVVVSFGHLIPTDVINALPFGILNVHPSLLPRWRGAAPIIHAVLNGDTHTGVTIMSIHPEKFDVGDIVRQYSVQIRPDETAKMLSSRLAVLGAQLLMECIRDLPRSVELTVPQSDEGITYARKIKPLHAFVRWHRKTAAQVYNQYRALCDIHPLTTYWAGLLVKLHKLQPDTIDGMNPENQKKVAATGESVIPGLVEYSRIRRLLRIQCMNGRWVCVSGVTIAGKCLTPKEFCDGYMSKVDSLDRKFEDARKDR